ncbi:MAG: adenylyltransferase/cytidyltransferase family protein, partial [Lachnospiraceae bacterium]|nr:adenylyltransferase/cytidyltransferase family protein [Lachnospiraceae bacterium]
MSEKPFRFALLVGRFQMLHLGHADMIRKALECADQVGILIGSSQESGTRTNPFSYELRAEILKKVFGEQI